MNDDEKMSSSNTTPFNNIRNHNRVLNNDKLAKYAGNRQIRPRNTNLNNERIDGDINNIPPIQDKKDSPNNNQQPVKENNKTKSRRNPFGPKNRLNNTASNLREKLDTNPDLKDEVAKKGAEALKKSANPYAKAAGYAASFLQNRKNKKKKEEQKEDDNKQDEDKNDDNNDNNEESSQGLVDKKTRTRLIIHLTLMIIPYVFGFIIILSAIMPMLNAYSWFQSLFHHKSDDAESYYIYNENQKEKSDEEIAFNNAIVGSKDGSVKGIIQEYKEKYGVEIDKYLLVATITYRYSVIDSEKLYTEDGNDDISDEEINSRLDELEDNDSSEETDSNENNNQTESNVDYSKAQKKINAVAALMIKKEGNSYTTDKEVGGNFYNTLIDSKFLKDYYKDLLSDDKYETRKKLVDEIFDYAEGARLMDDEEEEKTVNGGVVGDTSIVYLQSCTEPQQYKTKFVGNHEIYDNKLVNEGTNYPLYLSLKDYIKGVIYRENFSTDEKYRESIKVQAIMALSFLLRDSKSGFDLKNGEMYFPTETCRQATCDPNYGCTSVSGVASYSGTDRGNGTTHRALNEKEQTYLDSILDEVFGLVIVKKGVTTSSFSGSGDLVSFNYCNTLGECSSCRSGSCVGQTGANDDAASGMDYKAIFAKYFTSLEYDIINITDGLYYESSGDNFNGTIKLNESFHYHQGESPWGSQNLCDSGSISGNGCNITSAAIVISLLKNERITPETLNNRQSENPYCKQSSRSQMIQQFGKMYGLNVQIVNKGNTMAVHDMVLKIASGKYAAVARIAPNSGRYSTGSGHYVAIVGARSSNGTDQILVWDPATKSSSRDNVWVDVNYLVKYLQPDYSFILMGS